MVVVADTSPINYLVLIGYVDILGNLYRDVLVPAAVRRELLSLRAPQPVREYMLHPPSWMSLHTEPVTLDVSTDDLDPGEREAIHLAETTGAAKVLLDDLLARQAARNRGLQVIGTLGVLRDAARLGLIDIPSALLKLQDTSFNVSSDLIQNLLKEFD